MPRERYPYTIDSSLLLQCVRSRDDLTLVIRGHLCLESALNLLLAHMVPQSLEHLERLSFAGKVDLAIALDLVPMQLRDAWLGVNTIRNHFAHDLHARIDAKSAAALLPIQPPSDSLVAIAGAPKRAGASPRSQFAFAVTMLWTHAMHRFFAFGDEGTALPAGHQISAVGGVGRT
jgi:hypothetical protein